jgi:Alpha galactosidase A/Alpha galactosidase C-terminal beta sandwich domain
LDRADWVERINLENTGEVSITYRYQPRAISVAIAATLCAMCAICALAAAARAASTLSWSAPQTVDRQAPSAIACPTVTLCVAVDRAGDVLQTTDPGAAGPSWSPPEPIDPGHALSALACPSASLCVAVDDNGSELASTDPAGGAGSWAAARSIDSVALTGVSCASSSLCVAIDAEGQALVSSDPGDPAPTWTASDIDGATELRGVSCPSAALCVAVDSAGNALSSEAPASASPAAWHSRAIDLIGAPVAVSCASVSLCVAIDEAGNALASADAGAGNPTWSSTAVDLAATPASISCASSGLCVLLDESGMALAGDDPTAAVPSWSGSTADPGNRPAGISCLPDGLCAAVDDAGRALTATVAAPLSTSTTPTDVSSTAATLTGIVDPHDATLGACSFEYGPTASYGHAVPCASMPAPTGGAQTVQAYVGGLAASSTYHFRVIASNAGGAGASADEAFSTLTPPKIRVVHPQPSIAGVPGVGERLYCLSGIPEQLASEQGVTFRYAWLRDTDTIARAANGSYKVGAADAKHHLQCRVTATDVAGSATASSAFVAIPARGVIAAVGETRVGRIAVAGGAIEVPVRCSAQASRGCTITARATARMAVSRAGSAGRRRYSTVVLARASARLRPGQPQTVTLRLTGLARRVLEHAHRLAVTVSVRGTVIGIIAGELATTRISLRSHGRRIVARVGHAGTAGRTTAGTTGRTLARTPKRTLPGTTATAPRGATATAAPARTAALSGVLAATPYMGWDTYFAFGPRYSESTVLEQASLLISSGLAKDGYRYVWLDAGWWHGTRAGDGQITVNRRQWPHGMRWLAATLHGAGLKVGLYTDAGAEGCGGKHAGSYGHYQQDVNTFAAWGFDAVKVDFCGGVRQHLNPRAAYSSFQSAIERDSPHRPMLLSICDFLEPGQYHGKPAFGGSAFSSYEFGPGVGNSWRTDTDVGSPGYVPFASVLRNMDADATQPQAAGPGHWNDPDYLGPDQSMSEGQFRTQLSMWAMLAAPLMFSADLARISGASLQALANSEVIAVDQDPAGIQGTLLSSVGAGQVWVKPLSDGSRALALLNRSSSPLEISTTAAAIGMAPASSYTLRNLWTHRTTATSGAIAAVVPSETTVLLRVRAG